MSSHHKHGHAPLDKHGHAPLGGRLVTPATFFLAENKPAENKPAENKPAENKPIVQVKAL